MKIYGVGINDIPGFRTKNEREYKLWIGMLERCYSEKWIAKYPSYRECSVAKEWFTLSNFVRDLTLIDGYELWLKNEKRYDFDKDCKVKGNKIYSLDTVLFIPQAENVKEMLNRTGNLGGFAYNGYNEKQSYKVFVYTLCGKKVGEYNSNKECSDALGLDPSAITKCIKGKRKSTKGFIINCGSECETH